MTTPNFNYENTNIKKDKPNYSTKKDRSFKISSSEIDRQVEEFKNRGGAIEKVGVIWSNGAWGFNPYLGPQQDYQEN